MLFGFSCVFFCFDCIFLFFVCFIDWVLFVSLTGFCCVAWFVLLFLFDIVLLCIIPVYFVCGKCQMLEHWFKQVVLFVRLMFVSLFEVFPDFCLKLQVWR